MKEYIKEHYKVIAIVILLIVLVWTLYVDTIRTNDAKLRLIQQEADRKIDEATAKSKEKSDVEILEFRASESKHYSDEYMEDIEAAKELIKNTEPLYELELLRSKCFTNQISRKIDWLEYNINYCNNDENLKQFRTVK